MHLPWVLSLCLTLEVFHPMTVMAHSGRPHKGPKIYRPPPLPPTRSGGIQECVPQGGDCGTEVPLGCCQGGADPFECEIYQQSNITECQFDWDIKDYVCNTIVKEFGTCETNCLRENHLCKDDDGCCNGLTCEPLGSLGRGPKTCRKPVPCIENGGICSVANAWLFGKCCEGKCKGSWVRIGRRRRRWEERCVPNIIPIPPVWE